MFDIVSLFRRRQCAEALRLGIKAKAALMTLESNIAAGDMKAAAMSVGVLHERLAAVADETGRVMGVDVTPLSGGTKPPAA
jgi:hypothetical protein